MAREGDQRQLWRKALGAADTAPYIPRQAHLKPQAEMLGCLAPRDLFLATQQMYLAPSLSGKHRLSLACNPSLDIATRRHSSSFKILFGSVRNLMACLSVKDRR